MENTSNEDVIKKYFDLVQEEIKKLISEDKEIKPDQVQIFNDEIFNQPEAIQGQMRQYIDKATMNDLDIKRVAKVIYDKFKLQVKNNVFNQNDGNKVPNQLMGERKFIKTYEGFLNEYVWREFDQNVKPKWKSEDLHKLVKQLRDKLKEAKKFLGDKTKGDEFLQLPEIVKSLSEIELEETRELMDEIRVLISMIKEFSIEREIELSKLN